MSSQPKKTHSKDGTALAFDQVGKGPPVILTTGAFNDRRTGAPLAAFLAPRFSVINYDRRGRGDSGGASAYDMEREIEDLDAIIRAAGGQAAVLGYSSGAVLALRAGASGLPITRLALYEAPPAQLATHAVEIAALIAAGLRGDAVEYFQRRLVGIPEPVVAQLRHAAFRPALEAMAHTLVYDAQILAYDGLWETFANQVRQPVLAIAGSASPPVMRDVAERLGRSLLRGKSITLEGATHDIEPALLGPALLRFLDGEGG